MSKKYPVIAITGSSGSGTSTVRESFQHIFTRDGIDADIIEGDAFHRYERHEMDELIKKNRHDSEIDFSHFSPDANLLSDLEKTFQQFGKNGKYKTRRYVHTEEQAIIFKQKTGSMTPWKDASSELLFYEGLHGGYVGPGADVAKHVDLLVGVVPIINLEWIQKLHRDNRVRGYSQEAVIDTILNRMPDYINYIAPQFSRTHINFQRVPMVDTSNPFIAKDIPNADESFVVIRFDNPKGVDFNYLLRMLHGSMMTRPNTIVVPGGKMGLAMQFIFTPLIRELNAKRKKSWSL
jgi:phosphoribulokinase